MNNVDNQKNGVLAPEIPVTKLLAAFAASASAEQLTPAIRSKVKEVVVDLIGVIVGALDNADSTEPIYKAIRTLQGDGIEGPCTVVGKGKANMLPQYAALINSAFGHSLDFDDTYAEGSLHAGVTVISAALTQAELLGQQSSIDYFMLAVSVGYEIVCRLGRELGMESYDRGFHITPVAGIFGAVATIAVLKHLSVEIVEMAFGIAGSKAAGSMQYLDNGSWNKRLHPGFAVHDAFMCVSLAEAGIVGATRIIEGKMGFLQAYSPKENKDLDRLVAGLGTKWIWLNSSLKPYPACRMTHGFIELAGNIHSARKVQPDDIKSINLQMSPSCVLLVGQSTSNKIHPLNNIDAQFSAYFQVANALLYGSTTGIQAYSKLQDPGIMSLCAKTTVEADSGMTGFAAGLQVVWEDGSVDESSMQYPLGEVQHPFTRDKVDEKFLGLAEPVFGQKRASRIIQVVDNLEMHSIAELIQLLQ